MVLASRQHVQHTELIHKHVDNAEKSKAKAKELRQQMTTYERGVGALPPGARGIRGGGRSEHSTNLSLGQPASTSYASLPTEEDVTAETPEPKKQRKRSPSSRSTSRSTSSKTANNNALNVIQGFDNTLMRLVDRFPSGNLWPDRKSVV